MQEAKRAREEYLGRFLGRIKTVVPELYENGYTDGYTDNYIRVYIEGETGKAPVQVRIDGLFKDGVKGEIV